MKCKECEKLGLKSKVYSSTKAVTCMGSSPFYDENGKYHYHDMTTIFTDYQCSNGHDWTEMSNSKCWCGWSKDKQS